MAKVGGSHSSFVGYKGMFSLKAAFNYKDHLTIFTCLTSWLFISNIVDPMVAIVPSTNNSLARYSLGNEMKANLAYI